jgi:hypothetical protein
MIRSVTKRRAPAASRDAYEGFRTRAILVAWE